MALKDSTPFLSTESNDGYERSFLVLPRLDVDKLRRQLIEFSEALPSKPSKSIQRNVAEQHLAIEQILKRLNKYEEMRSVDDDEWLKESLQIVADCKSLQVLSLVVDAEMGRASRVGGETRSERTRRKLRENAEEMQALVDKHVDSGRGLSYERATAKVAEELNRSQRTIKNKTKNHFPRHRGKNSK